MEKNTFRELWEKILSSEKLESNEFNTTYHTISGSGTIDGNSPSDTISGTGTIDGNSPNDTISGSGTIDGNSPSDTISGTGTIDGNSPSDTISGSGTIDGNSPSDTISGSGTIDDNSPSKQSPNKLGSQSTIKNHMIPIVHHYPEEKKIAEGGMGLIIKAKQSSLKRSVAVKKIKASASKHRFLQESLITASLEHPHIIPIHELAVNYKQEVTLVMKKIEGLSWKELLYPKNEEQKQYAEQLIKDTLGKDLNQQLEIDEYLQFHLSILLKVCDAIAFAHDKNIIHNDLKPENIMVGKYGEVVVMDWGISVHIGEERLEDKRFLHKSEITSPMGTPSYMPSELAEGNSALIGTRTDIYLLGAILYEIIHGHAPHQGSSVWMVLLAARNGDIKNYDSLPQEKQELKVIYTKALQKNPKQRYATVMDFKMDIQQYFKHRDSIKLTNEAKEVLCNKETANSYNKFDNAISGFKNALKLWNENNEAQNGEQDARVLYANIALQNGDLGVVEAQLENMDASQTAKQLQEQVKVIKQQRIKRETRNRRLRHSLFFTIILIITGLTIGVWLINTEKNKTEEQRQIALNETKEKTLAYQKVEKQRIAAQKINIKFHKEKYIFNKEKGKYGEASLWLSNAIDIGKQINENNDDDKMALSAELQKFSRISWKRPKVLIGIQAEQLTSTSPIWLWAYEKSIHRGLFSKEKGWKFFEVLAKLGRIKCMRLWKEKNKLVAVFETKLFLLDGETGAIDVEFPFKGNVKDALSLKGNNLYFIEDNYLKKLDLSSLKVVNTWKLPYRSAFGAWSLDVTEKHNQALIMVSIHSGRKIVLFDMNLQKEVMQVNRNGGSATNSLKVFGSNGIYADRQGHLTFFQLGKEPSFHLVKTPWIAQQVVDINSKEATVVHEDAIRKWSLDGRLMNKTTVPELDKIYFFRNLPCGTFIYGNRIIVKDKQNKTLLLETPENGYFKSITKIDENSYLVAGQTQIEWRNTIDNSIIKSFDVIANEAQLLKNLLFVRNKKQLHCYDTNSMNLKHSIEIEDKPFYAINSSIQQGIIAVTKKGVFRFSKQLQRRELLYSKNPKQIFLDKKGVYFVDTNQDLNQIELRFYSWETAKIYGPILISEKVGDIRCYNVHQKKLFWGKTNGELLSYNFNKVSNEIVSKIRIQQIFEASGNRVLNIFWMKKKLFIARVDGVVEIWQERQSKYVLQETLKVFSAAYIKTILPFGENSFLLLAVHGEYVFIHTKEGSEQNFSGLHRNNLAYTSIYTSEIYAYPTKSQTIIFHRNGKKTEISPHKVLGNFSKIRVNPSQTILAAGNTGSFYVWNLNPHPSSLRVEAFTTKAYNMKFIDDYTLGIDEENKLLLVDTTSQKPLSLKKKYVCIFNNKNIYIQNWWVANNLLFVTENKASFYIFNLEDKNDKRMILLPRPAYNFTTKNDKWLFITCDTEVVVYDLKNDRIHNRIKTKEQIPGLYLQNGSFLQSTVIDNTVVINMKNKILFARPQGKTYFLEHYFKDTEVMHFNVNKNTLYWLSKGSYGYFSLPRFSTNLPTTEQLSSAVGKFIDEGTAKNFKDSIKLYKVK
ncbi:protein kinase [Candidatus Uabimicrobium sp. HlEnr_7]|uniref:protein kinase domain-containing protein n=1 Tax=Candidatus Uabimicrobium helgolandensis TaxID=3095367 RepID=UPI00355907A8